MAAQREFREPAPGRRSDGNVSGLRAAAAPRGRRRTMFATILAAAGLFSLGAGAIHAATIDYQFSESTLYGLTFVAFAVGQIGWWALATAFPSRPLAALGILGSAAVLVIWVITRTSGPPIGPAAGGPLPVTFPDSVATTLEGLAVVTALVSLLPAMRDGIASVRTRTAILVAAAAVALPLATLAVLSQMGVLTSLPAAT